MAATSTAPATPAVAQQTTPLFPSEDVEYIRLVTGDDHLFYLDKAACLRSSGTLRVMIEAQAALDGVEATDDDAPKKEIAILLDIAETPALEKVITFLYWRHRWINECQAKVVDWPIPRENQALIQSTAVLANFLEV